MKSRRAETETGKGSDALDRRPQLAAALAKARVALPGHRVEARPPLARRALHFGSDGASCSVRCRRACPDVEPFVLHLYGALAEKERALIAQRTRAALAAVKAKGVTLGNPASPTPAPGRWRRCGRRPTPSLQTFDLCSIAPAT